ncbi:exo-alpha-sialidase [bacterium]|nr:exo-alpha-sialidase [bacterium]
MRAHVWPVAPAPSGGLPKTTEVCSSYNVAGGPEEPGVLWCGTAPGGLFRSEDAGRSWRIVQSLWDRPERRRWFGGGYDYPGIHSVLVDPRDSNVLRLAISCGGVWKTQDGGGSWRNVGKGLRQDYVPPEQAYDLVNQDVHRLAQCQAAPDHLWVQHHNGVFKSEDGGETFTEITNVDPSVFGFAVVVHPKDPKTVWTVPAVKDEQRMAVDGKVVVSRTRDGGRSWEVLRKGLPQEHAYDLTYRHGLDISEEGDLLAFGSTTGSLWVSEDQGESWRTLSEHLPPVQAVRIF